MGNRPPDNPDSVLFANACISCIAQCAGEAEVQEAANLIVRNFAFQVYAFVVMVHSGLRAHYRYLTGCDPRFCHQYFRNKWYAIDPFVDYARQNTSPVLVADVPYRSPASSGCVPRWKKIVFGTALRCRP